MLQPTVLKCSQTTAFVFFLLLGSLFVVSGCRALYETIGLTDAQVDAQVAKDQATIQVVADVARTHTGEFITQIIAGAGAILSGFLAKWLGTERKITKAMIAGVETTEGNRIKTEIKKNALAAGVEKKLNARVRALT